MNRKNKFYNIYLILKYNIIIILNNNIIINIILGANCTYECNCYEYFCSLNNYALLPSRSLGKCDEGEKTYLL